MTDVRSLLKSEWEGIYSKKSAQNDPFIMIYANKVLYDLRPVNSAYYIGQFHLLTNLVVFRNEKFFTSTYFFR